MCKWSSWDSSSIEGVENRFLRQELSAIAREYGGHVEEENRRVEDYLRFVARFRSHTGLHRSSADPDFFNSHNDYDDHAYDYEGPGVFEEIAEPMARLIQLQIQLHNLNNNCAIL